MQRISVMLVWRATQDLVGGGKLPGRHSEASGHSLSASTRDENWIHLESKEESDRLLLCLDPPGRECWPGPGWACWEPSARGAPTPGVLLLRTVPAGIAGSPPPHHSSPFFGGGQGGEG